MCAYVPDLEWSGVLFYSTQGTFGESDFIITAEELYLMDIGSSTFTGYDYEADLIEYMMKNPSLMVMKKGHIHSHNKMSVFFSTTDTEEIHDNSEFHNYYLSLIVNNKNEMVAKVAFRGTRKTDSISVITYRGDDGEIKTGTYQNKIEDEVVYVYNCKIEGCEDKTLASKARAITTKKTTPTPPKVTGFLGGSAQYTLPFAESKKKNDTKKDESQPPFWEDDDWMIGSKKKTGSYPRDMIESFMSKLIGGDFISEDPLPKVLHKYKKATMREITELCKTIEGRMMNFYIDSFPDDQHLLDFNGVMEQCQEIITSFDDIYADLAEALWDVFNIEL